ncbi:hypothetical protein HPB49_006175 [Dermacentor silvarum]|uniref:Uncharacterized protein n=1 Tax=Dermacentor silvarum TaxID=543639 RepID=A0ACB8DIX0_DERSI|nr:hypothetical protein HPB49_006175 [Dermacentor silvarum]
MWDVRPKRAKIISIHRNDAGATAVRPGRVPIGPKGRVIKDCEWRYRHANVTDDVLSCKKCVKDYELRFPPRRLDVVKMRQTCVKPEERTKCIRCVEDYDLPENATKIQRENLTECERCVNETKVAENATFAEEEVHRCEECVDNYTLPVVFEYEDVEKAECEACVEKSNLHEDASYAYEAQVRSICMPREDIERCRKCAEEYMNDNNAANEVHSLDNNLKYRLLEECQQKIQEPVNRQVRAKQSSRDFRLRRRVLPWVLGTGSSP